MCAPMQTAAEGYNFLIFTGAWETVALQLVTSAFSNTHWHKTMHSAFKLKLIAKVLIQSFPFLLMF